MSWQPNNGTHQYRKEASRALRHGANKSAIFERERAHSSAKRASPDKRLFAIEFRARNKNTSMVWMLEWHLWQKYETAKQRDQAFESGLRNKSFWDLRKIDL